MSRKMYKGDKAILVDTDQFVLLQEAGWSFVMPNAEAIAAAEAKLVLNAANEIAESAKIRADAAEAKAEKAEEEKAEEAKVAFDALQVGDGPSVGNGPSIGSKKRKLTK